MPCSHAGESSPLSTKIHTSYETRAKASCLQQQVCKLKYLHRFCTPEGRVGLFLLRRRQRKPPRQATSSPAIKWKTNYFFVVHVRFLLNILPLHTLHLKTAHVCILPASGFCYLWRRQIDTNAGDLDNTSYVIGGATILQLTSAHVNISSLQKHEYKSPMFYVYKYFSEGAISHDSHSGVGKQYGQKSGFYLNVFKIKNLH